MELKADEIETLREAVDGCGGSSYTQAIAILDRLSPAPEPEVDEAARIWRGMNHAGDRVRYKGGEGHNYLNGEWDHTTGAQEEMAYLRQTIADLIASKDAETAHTISLLTEERDHEIARHDEWKKRTLEWQEKWQKAESELATLRAENEPPAGYKHIKLACKNTIFDFNRLNRPDGTWILLDGVNVNVTPKAAERNTAEPATDTTPEVDASVDSGMGAEAVEQAELLWAQLPVNRKWTSIPKHEKALVCHLLSTYRTEAEARGRREALEMTNAKWLVLADIVREADSAEDAARELKRLMTGGK